jgi:hypothetical protein
VILLAVALLALNVLQGYLLYTQMQKPDAVAEPQPVPFTASPYTDPDVIAAITAARGRPADPAEPPLPLGM